ncbi:MAG: hypothetical protein LBJ67_12275 [Planctomycetaceae bacterium]|jgi:hypothetical protein|nr:hypothetical protein [Planctomycetaceae bacterium]
MKNTSANILITTNAIEKGGFLEIPQSYSGKKCRTGTPPPPSETNQITATSQYESQGTLNNNTTQRISEKHERKIKNNYYLLATFFVKFFYFKHKTNIQSV